MLNSGHLPKADRNFSFKGYISCSESHYHSFFYNGHLSKAGSNIDLAAVRIKVHLSLGALTLDKFYHGYVCGDKHKTKMIANKKEVGL